MSNFKKILLIFLFTQFPLCMVVLNFYAVVAVLFPKIHNWDSLPIIALCLVICHELLFALVNLIGKAAKKHLPANNTEPVYPFGQRLCPPPEDDIKSTSSTSNHPVSFTEFNFWFSVFSFCCAIPFAFIDKTGGPDFFDFFGFFKQLYLFTAIISLLIALSLFIIKKARAKT